MDFPVIIRIVDPVASSTSCAEAGGPDQAEVGLDVGSSSIIPKLSQQCRRNAQSLILRVEGVTGGDQGARPLVGEPHEAVEGEALFDQGLALNEICAVVASPCNRRGDADPLEGGIENAGIGRGADAVMLVGGISIVVRVNGGIGLALHGRPTGIGIGPIGGLVEGAAEGAEVHQRVLKARLFGRVFRNGVLQKRDKLLPAGERPVAQVLPRGLVEAGISHRHESIGYPEQVVKIVADRSAAEGIAGEASARLDGGGVAPADERVNDLLPPGAGK